MSVKKVGENHCVLEALFFSIKDKRRRVDQLGTRLHDGVFSSGKPRLASLPKFFFLQALARKPVRTLAWTRFMCVKYKKDHI